MSKRDGDGDGDVEGRGGTIGRDVKGTEMQGRGGE